MSSKGRKLAKNIGKSLRKKFTDSEGRVDHQQDLVYATALDIDIGDGGLGGGAGFLHPGPPGQQKVMKSSSLGSIHNDDGSPVIVDQDDIIALTTDVKSFSDALAKLKTAFTSGTDEATEVHVLAHERLGEVICILKNMLSRYPALNSNDLFSSAGTLIRKIKTHNYESGWDPEVIQSFCDAIDQLALAFSSSVSEYLMGGGEPEIASDARTKSYDNLTALGRENRDGTSTMNGRTSIGQLSPATIDSSLVRLEAGLDLALQRAKAWSKYARDIMSYIEKKAQLESEYSKNLARLAQTMRPVLTEEGFLPLQSVYCTVLAQDIEFATNCQATQTLLQAAKFIEPLAARRAEHDKVRKTVKEIWVREFKKMQDAVSNLRKAQHMYITRQQEYDKAREQGKKADPDKADKRKKIEEDAMHKAAEAETTYKACVVETNDRQHELNKVKAELLAKIREQIYLCDQVMKSVTVEYFQLLHTVSAPLPVQFHTLCESSKTYEAGSQYAEFVRRLPIPTANRADQFMFEAFVTGAKYGETRKTSTHSNGSASSDLTPSNDGSPLSSPRKDKYRGPVRAWGHSAGVGSDTDSASGSSSNKSHDSSPSNSPHANMRRQLVASQSLDELVEEEPEKFTNGDEQRRNLIKRIMSANDEFGHHRGRRHTTFGVDFQEQVDQFKTEVPPIVSMCLSEIEHRGLTVKGVYRVSGVKSKVENLCQRFDIDPDSVELEEQHPNVICNVLKLYLRQLPEPLLTFRLYHDFIQVAKEQMSGILTNAKTIERLALLVRLLPPSNFKTCAVLMHHLQRVAAHSDVNQMSASNLGIVFGPTLLRPSEGTASLASLVDTPHQTRSIELLISSAQTIFGPGADYQLVGGETPIEQLPEHLQPGAGAKHLKAEVKEEVTIPVPADPPPPVKHPTSTPIDVPAEKIVQPADDVDSTALKNVGAEFVLPGSTSPGKSDNMSPTSTLTEDLTVSTTPSYPTLTQHDVNTHSGDDVWNDLDVHSDEDLPDNLLPDDSKTPGSANHQAVLTPHCMAGAPPSVKEVGPPIPHSVHSPNLASTSRPISSPGSAGVSGVSPPTATLPSSPILTRDPVHDKLPTIAASDVVKAKPTLTSIASGDAGSPLATVGDFSYLPPSPIKVVISEAGDSDDAHVEEIHVITPQKPIVTDISPVPQSTSAVIARSQTTQSSPPKTAKVKRSGSGSSRSSGTILPSLPGTSESRKISSSSRKTSRTSVTTVPTSSRFCLSRSMTSGTPVSSSKRSSPMSSSMTSRSTSALSRTSTPARRSLDMSSSQSRHITGSASGTRQRLPSGEGSTRGPARPIERKNSGNSGPAKRSTDRQSGSSDSSSRISQDRTPRFV